MQVPTVLCLIHHLIKSLYSVKYREMKQKECIIIANHKPRIWKVRRALFGFLRTVKTGIVVMCSSRFSSKECYMLCFPTDVMQYLPMTFRKNLQQEAMRRWWHNAVTHTDTNERGMPGMWNVYHGKIGSILHSIAENKYSEARQKINTLRIPE